MTKEQIYALLWRKLGYLTSKLNIEEYTELDGRLDVVAEIIETNFALQKANNELKEKIGQ